MQIITELSDTNFTFVLLQNSVNSIEYIEFFSKTEKMHFENFYHIKSILQIILLSINDNKTRNFMNFEISRDFIQKKFELILDYKQIDFNESIINDFKIILKNIIQVLNKK